VSQIEEFPEPLYVGRTSQSDRDLGPEELGRLEAALEVAYSSGRAGRSGHLKFRVVGIYVEGDNPISDYTVVVGQV
jgi:hypothetical protein